MPRRARCAGSSARSANRLRMKVRGVHVAVAAAVARGHQARLRLERQLVVERARGGPIARLQRDRAHGAVVASPGCGCADRMACHAAARSARPLRRGAVRRLARGPCAVRPARHAANSRQATALPSGNTSSPSSGDAAARSFEQRQRPRRRASVSVHRRCTGRCRSRACTYVAGQQLPAVAAVDARDRPRRGREATAPTATAALPQRIARATFAAASGNAPIACDTVERRRRARGGGATSSAAPAGRPQTSSGADARRLARVTTSGRRCVAPVRDACARARHPSRLAQPRPPAARRSSQHELVAMQRRSQRSSSGRARARARSPSAASRRPPRAAPSAARSVARQSPVQRVGAALRAGRRSTALARRPSRHSSRTPGANTGSTATARSARSGELGHARHRRQAHHADLGVGQRVAGVGDQPRRDEAAATAPGRRPAPSTRWPRRRASSMHMPRCAM